MVHWPRIWAARVNHPHPSFKGGEPEAEGSLGSRLFDQGPITVTPDYRVKVSPATRKRFENGRDYYALEGEELKIIPSAKRERPDPDRLAWHAPRAFTRGKAWRWGAGRSH